MYHYKDAGLEHVWLADGYVNTIIDGKKRLKIRNTDKLHAAIGRALCDSLTLSGGELKFLRKQMSLSQLQLAHLLGWADQAVAIYERTGRIPKGYDRMVVLLYLSHYEGKINTIDALQHILREGHAGRGELVFCAVGDNWHLATEQQPARRMAP